MNRNSFWKGAFSPVVKNYNNSVPEHGWDKFEVHYDLFQDFVYVTVRFDHRDICFHGENVPSNGKDYVYEVELNAGETYEGFKFRASRNFQALMKILRERATIPIDQEDVARIRSHSSHVPENS